MDRRTYKHEMKRLRNAFEKGEKFVLFIGAGQNAGGRKVKLFWNDLIRKACNISFREIFQEMGVSHSDTRSILQAMGIDPPAGKRNDNSSFSELVKYANSNFPVEIQVSIIKALMKDHYIPVLQSHLYSQCNYRIIKNAFALFAGHSEEEHPYKHFIPPAHNDNTKDGNNDQKVLYSLFIISRLLLMNHQIESVITYNFDNFIRQAVKVLMKNPSDFFSAKEIAYLEDRFKYANQGKGNLADRVKIVDIHGNGNNKKRETDSYAIPIYHVHGYIPDPHEEEIAESPDIVMALEEFVSQQTDGLSWQDSVQVNAFRDANIIFFGCSMTDLTMKRMINLAHSRGYNNKVYILGASPHNSDDNIRRQIQAMEKLRKWYFETLGAVYISCPNGYTALCDDLYSLTFNTINPQ